MVTVRSAKQKGSSYEMDCHESLKPVFSDMLITKQIGFQLQYDLITNKGKRVVECKRLKGISWNQLMKFYTKLENVNEEGFKQPYLLFQSNRQPCLVFFKFPMNGHYMIKTFEQFFNVPFVKHKSSRKKKVVIV